MDCQQCNEAISAYIDNELSVPEAREIELHLESCPPCAEELESLRESARFIEAHMRPPELRPEIWRGVQTRVSAMKAPSSAWDFSSFLLANRWVIATATLVLAAAIGIGYLSHLRNQESRLALQQYMNQYIQNREELERLQLEMRMLPGPLAVKYITPDNPFTPASKVSFQNPFRSEDQ